MAAFYWQKPDDKMPYEATGYDEIITVTTSGRVCVWKIADFQEKWHVGDARARHTWLWTYKPN